MLEHLLLFMQGIEFLDVLLDLLTEQRKLESDLLQSVMCTWINLLVQLVDILGETPQKHLKYFISGKQKVLKKYSKETRKYVSIIISYNLLWVTRDRQSGACGIRDHTNYY